ncbi:MAG: helix-turn-helix transcriptional regulator [Lentisphaerae bacterium]|jgi:transcriptional regulator with XRE-family HTH domain|nr:helix-turn-helix transcriptional regulator [Lentisphaerota bacterium]
MGNHPAQIAARIREMRQLLEMTTAEVADKLGIDRQLYEQYESDQASIPISTLYELAEIFSTDFTILLTGDAPRMGDYTLVRAGQGVKVDRHPGYKFSALAFNYIGRTMEPMLVDLEDDGSDVELITHSGQEFNLVLSGSIKVILGKREFVLNQGDACYFNPRVPHGQRAVGGPARFLTVIQH